MLKTIRPDWYFIIAATLVGLAVFAVTAWDFTQVQQAGYRFQLVNLIGVGLMMIGLALRLAARRALGRHFSYALRTLDEHKLIKHGVYKRVRHPAYTGDLLFWSGVTLLFSSWAGFLVTLLLIPCFIYRAKIEENMLSAKFGDEYRKYMKTTKRFVPYLY